MICLAFLLYPTPPSGRPLFPAVNGCSCLRKNINLTIIHFAYFLSFLLIFLILGSPMEVSHGEETEEGRSDGCKKEKQTSNRHERNDHSSNGHKEDMEKMQ